MFTRSHSPAAQLGSISNRSAAVWREKESFSPHRILFLTEEPRQTSLVAAKSSREKLDRDRAVQRVEAVLFLAREPLPSRKLAQLAQIDDGTQARTLVRRLNAIYDRTGRAFRVEELAGGFQLLTRKKFADWVRRLGYDRTDVRLSAPMLETLAVVAYRQPVLKAEIEAIRGVNCAELIRQLMERDLVRIGGRSEELGRPYLYSTTKRFLQVFGLRSTEELPEAEFIRSSPVPPVFKTASGAQDTSRDTSSKPDAQPASTTINEEKESEVSLTISSELAYEEELARKFGATPSREVRMDDDDDDFEDDDFEDDDDDDDDDLEDDEEEDDLEEEEDDLDDDEEWEEVEDEEEDEAAEDEEEDDDDWEDDEDDLDEDLDEDEDEDDDWEEDDEEDEEDDVV